MHWQFCFNLYIETNLVSYLHKIFIIALNVSGSSLDYHVHDNFAGSEAHNYHGDTADQDILDELVDPDAGSEDSFAVDGQDNQAMEEEMNICPDLNDLEDLVDIATLYLDQEDQEVWGKGGNLGLVLEPQHSFCQFCFEFSACAVSRC